MKTLILVIDPQERLTRVIPGWPSVAASIRLLVHYARLVGWPVIVTRQVKLGELDSLVREELEGFPVFVKKYFDPLREEEIKAKINELNPDRVIIVGIETHICVYQAAKHLVEMGKKVVIPPDAVASQIGQDHVYALKNLEKNGVETVPVETIIYKDMENPEHPAFKEILEYVKNRRKTLI